MYVDLFHCIFGHLFFLNYMTQWKIIILEKQTAEELKANFIAAIIGKANKYDSKRMKMLPFGTNT